MNREDHKWLSPALGREMELLVFGHAGTPAIAFSTSCGRFDIWGDNAGHDWPTWQRMMQTYL